MLSSACIVLLSAVDVNTTGWVPSNEVNVICIDCVWLSVTTTEFFDRFQVHVQLDDILVFGGSENTTTFVKNQSPLVEHFDRFVNF